VEWATHVVGDAAVHVRDRESSIAAGVSRAWVCPAWLVARVYIPQDSLEAASNGEMKAAAPVANMVETLISDPADLYGDDHEMSVLGPESVSMLDAWGLDNVHQHDFVQG